MSVRLAGAVLLVWAVLAMTGPLLALAPNTIHLENILAPPSTQALLGFDDLGRDILARLLVGARTSFLVALLVVSLSLVTGTVAGTLGAWYGGWADRCLSHLTDIFLAFPGILLAIALAGVLGPGLANVVIALSAVGWVGFARLARAQVLALRQREHVQAAAMLGSGQLYILRHHLLPLAAAALIVEATFGVASVVIAEAGLSFLGLGVQPPVASWGTMIRDGARYMLVAPHMVLAPGIAILAVVLAVNLVGDRLRDRFDTRLVTRSRGEA